MAGSKGKYRVVFSAKGYLAVRSKLAYGKTISTVGPPAVESLISKVKFHRLSVRLLCISSLTKYRPVDKSRDNPSSLSNLEHASVGRIIHGTVESMNVFIGDVRSAIFDLVRLVAVIACRPTTRSREISPAIEKVMLWGTNRERSYPPKVRLPKIPLRPMKTSESVLQLIWYGL